MNKALAFVSLALLAIMPAFAQSASTPNGIPLDLAIDAAKAAIDTCKGYGYNVVVLVMDNQYNPMVIVHAPGAPKAEDAASNKAYTAVKLGISSGQFGASVGFKPTPRIPGQPRAPLPVYNNDPRLDPFAGAVPVRIHGQISGAVAVAGGGKDDDCARAGLARIANRLD